jgi:hypothetical protein
MGGKAVPERMNAMAFVDTSRHKITTTANPLDLLRFPH